MFVFYFKKSCPYYRDLVYDMISIKSDSLYAQDCTTRIGFLRSPPHLNPRCYTATAVQRHWLCSTFSIKSSPVEEGSADREANHQFIELKLHYFTSMHIQSGPPSSLSTVTSAHLLYCHPALPALHTLSLLSLQLTKARRVSNLPSAHINSGSYLPYCK